MGVGEYGAFNGRANFGADVAVLRPSELRQSSG